MRSTVAAMFASTAGWRYGMPVTMHPTRIRVVACASAARVVQPSRQGPLRSPPRIGSKWSKFQADSNSSMASAACQTWSIASQVVICGAVLMA